MKNILMFGCLLFFWFSSPVLANERAFNQQNFEQVKAKRLGKQWLMLLWSLDCPPCFQELSLVSTLYQQNKDLAVILVNVDDDFSYFAERQQVMKEFNLQSITQLNFTVGSAMKNRQSIDAQWHGELPRSYFFNTDGSYQAKSGLVNKSELQHWLK